MIFYTIGRNVKMTMQAKGIYSEYKTKFLLSFAGDEVRALAPLSGTRNIYLVKNEVPTKETLEEELRRFYAGINEFSPENVQVEVLNFEQI